MVISVQCFSFPICPCFLCYCDDSRCMYRMMDITLDPTRVLHLTSVQHPPKKSQEKPITKENFFFVQIFWNFLQRSGEIFVFKNEFGERERRNNVGVWEWPQMVQICPTTKKHVFFFVLCNLPLFLLWIKK